MCGVAFCDSVYHMYKALWRAAGLRISHRLPRLIKATRKLAFTCDWGAIEYRGLPGEVPKALEL